MFAAAAAAPAIQPIAGAFAPLGDERAADPDHPDVSPEERRAIVRQRQEECEVAVRAMSPEQRREALEVIAKLGWGLEAVKQVVLRIAAEQHDPGVIATVRQGKTTISSERQGGRHLH